MEKYYQTNLEIGYNIKDEGLVWVLKRIGLPKSYDHLPRFLNTAEKNFLVEVMRCSSLEVHQLGQEGITVEIKSHSY